MQLKLPDIKALALLLLITHSLLLFSGCARTVTEKTIGGNTVTVKELELTFTFNGTPGGAGKTYYLIIASQNIMNVINPSRLDPYFFAPGEEGEISEATVRSAYNLTVDQDLQKIYDDYFSTWTSYIKYTGTDQFLYYNDPHDPDGPPVPYLTSANYTAYPYNLLSYGNLAAVGSNQIKFRIAVPYDSFYIDFLAVDSTRRVRDSLDSKRQIVFSNNLNLTEPASSYAPSDGGLDIISFTIKGYEY